MPACPCALKLTVSPCIACRAGVRDTNATDLISAATAEQSEGPSPGLMLLSEKKKNVVYFCQPTRLITCATEWREQQVFLFEGNQQ